MNRNGLTVLFSWFLVFIWLVVIFYLSAQPAADSSNLSKKVTKVIIEIIPLDNEVSTTENLIAKLEPHIRKLGHFSEYFGLFVNIWGGIFLNPAPLLFLPLFLCYD